MLREEEELFRDLEAARDDLSAQKAARRELEAEVCTCDFVCDCVCVVEWTEKWPALAVTRYSSRFCCGHLTVRAHERRPVLLQSLCHTLKHPH